MVVDNRKSFFEFVKNNYDGNPSEQECSDFYDTVKILDDDLYLADRLEGENRHLRRYPEIKQQILQSRDSADDKSIIDTVESIAIARDIYNIERTKQPNALAQILDHLNLCNNVYDLYDRKDDDVSMARASAIASLSAKDLVSKIPTCDIPDYQLTTHYLVHCLEPINTYKKLHRNSEWYYENAKTLQEYINSRADLLYYIDKLSEENDLEYIADEQIELDNKNITDIFKQALNNRCYGVKNGCISQTNNDGMFIYIDTDIFRESYSNSELCSQIHTLTLDFSENSLAAVVDIEDEHISKDVKNYFKLLTNPDTTFEPKRVNIKKRSELILANDGSLSCSLPSTPIEYCARDVKKYYAYRKLQAEILANFIDLVTPIEYSKKAKEYKLKEDPLRKSCEQSNAIEIIKDLLIPRIKAAVDDKGEHSQPESNGSNQTEKREVRLHGVIWHIRQLPEGWHASPQAIEMAKQAGIILNDRETFVRPHTRGSKSVGEVAVHSLIKRPVQILS